MGTVAQAIGPSSMLANVHQQGVEPKEEEADLELVPIALAFPSNTRVTPLASWVTLIF